MGDIPAKACVRCGQSRPLIEFGVDRKSADGLNGTCRKCRSDIQGKRRYKGRPDYSWDRPWKKAR